MKKSNFWQKLKAPIYCLAPMAGVTDSAFREIAKSYGADVVYSEMISATALVYDSKKTLEMMKFDKKERPFVVQLFGSNPEHFAFAARLVTKKIKPDGIDINFGCPVKKVQKQRAGATLMGDLKLAKKVVKAVIDNTNLPVSVKCRSSVPGKNGKQVTALDFLKAIKGLDVKAVMIHGRKASQAHSGPVDMETIKKARAYFDGALIANGGVKDAETAKELLEKTGADGIGIGQGAMGKPWIFKEVKSVKSQPVIRKEIYKLALKHARLAYKLKGKQGIVEMRKHLCWYVAGLPGAAELRGKLVKVETIKDIEKILK